MMGVTQSMIKKILYNISNIKEELEMKYAVVNGKLTHVNKVAKGTIAREFGYTNYLVIACKGKYRSYWKYVNIK